MLVCEVCLILKKNNVKRLERIYWKYEYRINIDNMKKMCLKEHTFEEMKISFLNVLHNDDLFALWIHKAKHTLNVSHLL